MPNTWILVSNNRHARFLQRSAESYALDELADFIYPHSSMASETPAGDISGDAGKGHGRTAHSGTQFEPKTSEPEKERHSFARQLADYVNKGVSDQRCDRLVLIASSQMLGELRPLLTQAAHKMLYRTVAADLTKYQGEELRQRVKEAMAPPG
jgi:protein required for attachment to host cells